MQSPLGDSVLRLGEGPWQPLVVKAPMVAALVSRGVMLRVTLRVVGRARAPALRRVRRVRGWKCMLLSGGLDFGGLKR